MRGDVATVRAGASGDASSVTKEDDDDDDDAFLRFLEDSMDGKTTQSAASDGLNWEAI